jgi:hypothetical protein
MRTFQLVSVCGVSLLLASCGGSEGEQLAHQGGPQPHTTDASSAEPHGSGSEVTEHRSEKKPHSNHSQPRQGAQQSTHRQERHHPHASSSNRQPPSETFTNSSSSQPESKANADPLAIFNKRILPIMQAKNPSSCSECHLSGVDLKDYILEDQSQTFAALRDRGMIDVKNPEQSKILMFIGRQTKKPTLITDRVRRQELDAFRAWIVAAVNDPDLLKTAASDSAIGSKLPDEVIRHARRDRVLSSFIENVWSEVARCSGCHSPANNQKQVKEHGEQVSWIKLRDPQATLDYMVEASIIDVDSPNDSMLLTKPTMQVEHGGGKKLEIGDRTYKQFRRFIDDYIATRSGKYKSAEQLPKLDAEIGVATSMKAGIWFKLTGVPKRFDKKLLQVDIYRRDGDGWSKTRWATADRAIAGTKNLWQQTLTITAPRNSRRAKELRRAPRLPAGEYRVKIYIDTSGKLQKDPTSPLDDSNLVGETTFSSKWPTGYGRMTTIRFPMR